MVNAVCTVVSRCAWLRNCVRTHAPERVGLGLCGVTSMDYWLRQASNTTCLYQAVPGVTRWFGEAYFDGGASLGKGLCSMFPSDTVTCMPGSPPRKW